MTRRATRFWAYLALVLSIGMIVGSLVFPHYAYGHTAPSGWEYDRWCCDGTDCAQIPSSAVKITSSGYLITLQPGDHPMVTKPHTFVWAFGGTRVSQDEHFHLCFWPSEDTPRCFYAPPLSF